MFAGHVDRLLSAYGLGDLDPGRSGKVASHLMRCRRCRAAFEEIRAGVERMKRLPETRAPEDIWRHVESALEARFQPAVPGRRSDRWTSALSAGSVRTLAAAAASVVLIPLVAVAWSLATREKSVWGVDRVEGSPTVGSRTVSDQTSLGVGQWLETDASSRARVTLPRVGRIDLEPDTRLGLVETSLTEHRVALDRGTIRATIWAPPRIFIVETAAATAVDLGCAYTFSVDRSGDGSLVVTVGWVELQREGRGTLVPAGARCTIRSSHGPGTPIFDDAPEEMRSAVARLDLDPDDAGALQAVLGSARGRDTLTLWHLLPRVRQEDRGRLVDRIAALSPPPEGVTRDAVARLDGKALERWRRSLERTWHGGGVPTLPGSWREIWKYLLRS